MKELEKQCDCPVIFKGRYGCAKCKHYKDNPKDAQIESLTAQLEAALGANAINKLSIEELEVANQTIATQFSTFIESHNAVLDMNDKMRKHLVEMQENQRIALDALRFYANCRKGESQAELVNNFFKYTKDGGKTAEQAILKINRQIKLAEGE